MEEQYFDLNKWKKYKEQNNFTFEELSKRAGVKISGLKDIFIGITKDPRISSVVKIEQALGIRHYVAVTPTPQFSSDEIKLVQMYRQVSQTWKENVMSTLYAALGKTKEVENISNSSFKKTL